MGEAIASVGDLVTGKRPTARFADFTLLRSTPLEWKGTLKTYGDDYAMGFVTYSQSTARFNDLCNVPTAPSDDLWHCCGWMDYMGQVATVAAKADTAPGFALPILPTPSLLLTTSGAIMLRWLFDDGGLLLEYPEQVRPCGFCLGCVSFPRNREQSPESWVYFIQGTDGGPVKIGRSASPIDRLSALQTANPATLRIVAKMAGGGAVERSMHALFAADRIRPDGEWFRASQALTAFMREVGGV